MSQHLTGELGTPELTRVAALIATIWAELFDDDQLVVAAEDNFFKLGGSSLLGLQLVDKLNARFAIQLNLLDLVEAKNLGDLSRRVAELTGSGDAADDMEEGEL